jgi:hypothetical protein
LSRRTIIAFGIEGISRELPTQLQLPGSFGETDLRELTNCFGEFGISSFTGCFGHLLFSDRVEKSCDITENRIIIRLRLAPI